MSSGANVLLTRPLRGSQVAISYDCHDHVLGRDPVDDPVKLAHRQRLHDRLENYVKLSFSGQA